MVEFRGRFKRVAEVFEEVARARSCENSGSEHSRETSIDLSDLVKLFTERGSRGDGDDDEIDQGRDQNGSGYRESYCSDSELKHELIGLLGFEDDELKQNIRSETEQAYQAIGNCSSSGFKRRLMTQLRERGFDAGLCKSKWERTSRFPSESYEYIDVNVAGTRYIIEVCLASEFQIARATTSYCSLLETLPSIFVGKVEELKQVVRLMCNAIRDSMEIKKMNLPPWREHGYMKVKWFGSYKRTMNEDGIEKASDSDAGTLARRKRSVGFVPLPEIAYHCREDFASQAGLRVGQLAMAINGTDMLH